MARIAVFSLTYPPFVGGAEVAIGEIARRLPQHSFTVFTARLWSSLVVREKVGAVEVVRVGTGSGFDKFRYPWVASRQAVQEHTRVPFDAVWGMMASWGGWGALRFRDRYPNVPYILTEQSGDSDAFIRARTWFWQPRYRQIYTKADAVTAISRFLADRAKRYGANNVTLVPNGVDVAAFGKNVSEVERRMWRQRLSIPDESALVLSISRLVKKNGIEDLISALPLIQQNVRGVQLVIAGSGPLLMHLQNHARHLGVEPYVKFIGHVEHAELPALLATASVFVRPSLSEGFGNVFIEAMAAGVPAVATPVGGIVDFLQDGVNGYMAQPNDPSSVAAAIIRAISDRDREKIIQAAKTTAQRYDWESVSGEMEKVFRSVLKV